MVEARLRRTVGTSYLALGRYDLAEPHLEGALEIRRALLGEKHPNTLESMNDVGELYHWQDRLEEAEPLCRRTLANCIHVFGEQHEQTGSRNCSASKCRNGRSTYA